MAENWTRTHDARFDKKSALKMNEIAKTVFAQIYPVIAENAIKITGIDRGICIDLGCGPAMLSMAVAKKAPEMKVIALDSSEDSRMIAMENIREAELDKQVVTAMGDVHSLPFEDGYADLIVSRGSMFFWNDLKGSFREIIRVLAPGGATYIGGGFGSSELKDRVVADMLKVNPSWDCYAKKKTDESGMKRFEEMFGELGCTGYRIIDDGTGFWIVINGRKR